MSQKKGAEKAADKVEETTRVRWDHSRMKTSYANVCNVSSTREEVSVMFGINQTMTLGNGEIVIELTDRVILNPFAAKRLAIVLDGVIRQYEATFGELSLEAK